MNPTAALISTILARYDDAQRHSTTVYRRRPLGQCVFTTCSTVLRRSLLWDSKQLGPMAYRDPVR